MKSPYKPDLLPLDLSNKISYPELVPLIGAANSAISEYNGMLKAIRNPNILLSTLLGKEAELSSRIEGTQASYEEVLEEEAGELQTSLSKRNDIAEIKNYRSTLLTAQHSIQQGRSLSLGMILALHQELMDSVRGKDKTPGKFRVEQNWIGFAGSTIEDAIFIPPDPIYLNDYLQNWENYLSYKECDPIIHVAIMHAQFELLHPFNDGNGRVGRLLIPLILYKNEKLSSPNFYLSEYLEKNRALYYERLKGISSESNDWNAWIQFFLHAVLVQSKSNIDKVQKILNLYEEMKVAIQSATNSPSTMRILDCIFEKPLFNTNYITEQLGVSKPTANGLLTKLLEAEILFRVRQGSGRRPSVYGFKLLLDIINSVANIE